MSIFESYINEAYSEDESKSGIELFVDETLFEYALFTNNHQYKYSLYVDPDQSHKLGFLNDPYIKIYDGQSFDNSNNCIRVHLKDGRCEHHNDKKGGLPFSDSGWKKFLDEVILKNSTNKDYSNLTVFDAVFKAIQNAYNMTDNEMKPYLFSALPSYKTACY